jgi:hypothetical protein
MISERGIKITRGATYNLLLDVYLARDMKRLLAVVHRLCESANSASIAANNGASNAAISGGSNSTREQYPSEKSFYNNAERAVKADRVDRLAQILELRARQNADAIAIDAEACAVWAATHRSLEVLRWLYSRYGPFLRGGAIERIRDEAAKHGSLPILRWMWQKRLLCDEADEKDCWNIAYAHQQFAVCDWLCREDPHVGRRVSESFLQYMPMYTQHIQMLTENVTTE